MLESGCTIPRSSYPFWNAPVLAFKYGHYGVLAELLRFQAEAEKMLPGFSTPLCSAAHLGQTDEVERLVNSGINVDERRKDGLTPLLLAIRGGHVGTVRKLVQLGANLNDWSHNLTPEHIAAMSAAPDTEATLNGISPLVSGM